MNEGRYKLIFSHHTFWHAAKELSFYLDKATAKRWLVAASPKTPPHETLPTRK